MFQHILNDKRHLPASPFVGLRGPIPWVLTALLLAVPAAGQRSAVGEAHVQVPTISELTVQSHDGSLAPTSPTSEVRTGAFRLRVRANHAWKVVLGVRSGVGGELWVRPAGGSGDYERVAAGSELSVATGGGGEELVEVEYRWEPGDPDSVAPVPLTYTLASAD